VADPSPADITTVLSVFGGVGGIGSLIIVLIKSLGGRVVETEDKANTTRDERISKTEGAVVALESRLTRFDEKLSGVNRELGRAENEQSRLLGKIEGLQTDWRGRFEKLQDELRVRDERLAERLIESKNENARGLDGLRETFEAYRLTMHERFNELTRLFVDQQREILDAEARERRTTEKG